MSDTIQSLDINNANAINGF